MTKLATIYYPGRKHRKVPATTFIAYGEANSEVGAVLGLLVQAGVTKYKGTTLIGPGPCGRWLVYFDKVADGNYTLEIVENAQGDTLDATPITVKNKGAFGLQIISPANNDSICRDFNAYGTTDVAGTVSAQMDYNGTTVPGTSIQQPSQTIQTWIIGFQGVPAGSGWKFSATQGSTVTNTGITVVGDCGGGVG
jgi:hypothetical protein